MIQFRWITRHHGEGDDYARKERVLQYRVAKVHIAQGYLLAVSVDHNAAGEIVAYRWERWRDVPDGDGELPK